MRVAKLVKYLPAFGWASIVVTAPGDKRQNTVDDDLLRDVACVGKIYRSPVFDMRKLFHLAKSMITGRIINLNNKTNCASTVSKVANVAISTRSSIAARYLVPDHYVTWIPGAILQGIRAIRKNDIAVIYSTSPLQSALLVGYVLHVIFRKPWIVEMRDPWTTNPFGANRAFSFLERIDSALERKVLMEADRIVVIAHQFIAPIIRKYPFLDVAKFVVLPNGYDPEDFDRIEPRKLDKFTIVHTGSFYEGRSPIMFLRAIKKLVDEHFSFRNEIQVKFIGGIDLQAKGEIERLGLNDIVEMLGQVPHSKSLQYVVNADLLLLIPGPGESTMTGKIFEYLAAQRPILAIADKGVVRELVTSSGIGIVASTSDLDEIAKTILKMYKLITSEEGYPYPMDPELRSKYDRKQIAGKIAELMQGVMRDSRHRG